MIRILYLSLLLIIFVSNLVRGQEIDPAFKPTLGGAVNVRDAVLQSDQKLLVLGNIILAGNESVGQLIRLNADGSLDLTFTLDPAIEDIINEIAVQQSGKILAVLRGDYPSYNTLIRLNSDGSLDDTFAFPAGDYNWIRKLTIDAEDRFYFLSDKALIRSNIDGSIDPTFSVSVSGGNITTIKISSDHKILIAGDFNYVNETGKNHMARINPDGSIDQTFDIGSGTDNSISNFEITSDGKYLIIGRFTKVSGSSFNQLAKLNSDGSLDNAFNPNAGFATGYDIKDLKVDASGKVVLAGNFQSPEKRILRLDANGNLDTSFDPGTGFTSDAFFPEVKNIFINNGGEILALGSFSRFNGNQRVGLARLLPNGSLDMSYNAALAGKPTINTIEHQPDGKILVGGSFLTVQGEEQINISRLNSDGSLDLSFNTGTGADAMVKSIKVQEDGKILVGGEFAYFNGDLKRGIIRLNADGSTDPTFSGLLTQQYSSDGVYEYFVQSNGQIIIAGGFYKIDGIYISHFARLNADGSLDPTFNAANDVPARVRDLEVLANGNFLIGGYDPNENGFVSLRDPDGNRIESFNTPSIALPRINAIEVQVDGKIIVGGNSSWSTGFLTNASLFRLNADGSLDNSFNISKNGYVNDLALLPGGDLLVGEKEMNLARYSTDGTLDVDFSWYANKPVLDINSVGGNYLLGGSFTKIGNHQVYGIARITSTVVNSPSNLMVNETSPILNWKDNASDETAFEVFRSTNFPTDFILLSTVDADVTNFEDVSFEGGIQYFYKVRAVRSNEVSAFSEIISFPGYQLAPPSGLKISSAGTTHIGLAWSNSVYSADYVQLIRSQDGQPDVKIYIENNVNTYQDNGLTPDTKYTYTIRNVNAFGISELVAISMNTLGESLKRSGAVSFVIGTDTFIGLGRNESAHLQDFVKLNVGDYSTTTIAPFPGLARANAISFVLDGMGYVGLGQDEAGNVLADMYKYDPTANAWSALNDFSGGARRSAIAFEVGGNAYVGTGHSGTTDLDDFYTYAPATDSWTLTSAFSGDKRREAVAFVIADKAYVVGGYSFDGSSFQQSDVQEFDASTGTWKEVVFADFNLSFNNATAFTFGNAGYIAYGNHGKIARFNPSDRSVTDLGDVLKIDNGEIGDSRADAVAFVVDNIPYFSGGRSGFFTELIHGDIYNLSIINKVPIDIQLSAYTIAENSPANTLVGTLNAIDADADDTHSFHLLAGDGSNDSDNDLFQIIGNELRLSGAGSVNFEEKQVLNVLIETLDSKGGLFHESLAITVLDRNDPPTSTMETTTLSMDENQELNAVIGTISSNDEDGDELSYSITAGNSSALTINSIGKISVADPSAFNFEQNSELLFTVRANDGQASGNPLEIKITLIDINDAPTLSLDNDNPQIDENSAEGTIAAVVLGEDEDGDDVTYAITDNSGAFTINSSGEISVLNAELLNFEENPSFQIGVVTNDGALSSKELLVVINLLDVNETPVISVLPESPMIDENALKGDYLTSLSAIDEDGDEVTFTIVSGNTKNAFIIDKNDIILNNPYALDVRENPFFLLIVEGSDGALVSSVEITVTVNDIPGFVTSLTDEVNTTRPNFYPNPLEGDFVYLNLPQHQEIGDVVVYDTQGRRQFAKWEIKAQNILKVHVENLSGGVYYLVFKGGNQMQHYKIVIP